MRLEALIHVLLLFSAAVQAFRFTSPDPNETLNVSRPVEIAWEGVLLPDRPPIDQVALRFNVTLGEDGSGGFSWELVGNLSQSDRSFTWYPNMSNWELDILDERVHLFHAVLVNGWSGRTLAVAESERFAIEGYPNLVGEGARPAPMERAVLAVVLAGLAVVYTSL